MTQALVNPNIPSGPYTATWGSSGTTLTNSNSFTGSALDIGLFEGPIRLQQNIIGLPIRASQWGQTVIDYIIQGGGCFGVIVLKEWNANTKKFLWPFGANQTAFASNPLAAGATADLGRIPKAGAILSKYTAPLVLTALPGTPAATYGPVTRTYYSVATLPGHNIDLIFGPMERNVVIAVACLPVIDTGDPTGQARFFLDT